MRTIKRLTTLWYIPNGTELHVAAVTVYELYMGATTPQKRKDVPRLLAGFSVLPLTRGVAEQAARIYLDLRSRNQLIEHRDILIAATSVTHNLPMKTLNHKHFSRVSGLQLA